MGAKIVYNHKAIEKKWHDKWQENPVNPRFRDNGEKKEKYYCLDMFPYPSGNGLHVGHWRGYVLFRSFRLRTMRSRWEFILQNPQQRT